MPVVQRWQPWIVVLLLTAGSGCAQPDPYQAYLDAVATALDRPLAMPTIRREAYPTPRELKLPVLAQQIDWVQFAQLHVCDLGDLVGRRNSALGRVAADSQRLVYELEFVSRLDRCRAHNDDLPDWLHALAESKRTTIPNLWWNAVLAGPEMQQALTATATNTINGVSGHQQLHALRQKVAGTVARMDAAWLESQLRLLAAAGVGVRIFQWQQLTAVLETVARSLNARVPPVCLSDQPTPRSKRLLAILQRYYLPLQAHSVASGRDVGNWLIALDGLVAQFADPAPAFIDWRNKVEVTRQALEAGVAAHQQAWQNLLDSCGMSVEDFA